MITHASQNNATSKIKNFDGLLSQIILLVEGLDDLYLLQQFIMTQFPDLTQSIHIHAIKGDGEFKGILRKIRSEDEFVQKKPIRIGLITDSDGPEIDKLKAVQDIIKDLNKDDTKTNFPTLKQAEKFYTHDFVSLGLFIMPSAEHNGEIEDLLLYSLDRHQTLCHVEDFLTAVEGGLSNKPKYSKRKMMSYLATQVISKDEAKIITSISQASEEGCWDFTHPAFTPLKTFLTQLFGDPQTP